MNEHKKRKLKNRELISRLKEDAHEGKNILDRIIGEIPEKIEDRR